MGRRWAARAAVAWPGRCEQVRPGVYIDVGHTPAAAATFCAAMSALPGPIRLVLGVSQNKDARGIIRELLPMASLLRKLRILLLQVHVLVQMPQLPPVALLLH